MAVAFKWRNAQDNNFVGSATSINVGATSPAFSNGAFAAGDILLASVTLNTGTGNSVTPPSGWTQIGAYQLDVNSFGTAYFWRLADGTESGSFTFTFGATSFACWTLIDYSGAAASPFDGTSVTSTYTGGAGTTTAITTINAGDMLVLFITSGGGVITVPSDMTTRFNALQESNTDTTSISDRLPGSTGSFTESFTVASVGAGSYCFVALKPASAAAVSTPGILGLASSEW
jgi:hypothetical protein